MKAALVVVVFNRPAMAAQLRERLGSEAARKLFVISDGPRPERPGEAERVERCRELFARWPGGSETNFAETNMGCKARISSGLNWVFERVDRAIILEDDCLPSPDFFGFADEMLARYAADARVMSVCGTKTFPGKAGDHAAYFSRYNNCWGWATWKRAWSLYDDKFSQYSSLQVLVKLARILGSYRAGMYWSYLLRKVLKGEIDSWAYCWMISCFLSDAVHVFPSTNLVVNGGIGAESTHTKKPAPYMPQQYGSPLTFPLSCPAEVAPLEAADRWIEDNMYSKSLPARVRWALERVGHRA